MRPVRIAHVVFACVTGAEAVRERARPLRRRWWRPVVQAVGTAVIAFGGSGLAAATEFLGEPPPIAFQIVVHRSHPGGDITPLQLRRIFLRQITRWPDGRPVVPVNGPPDSVLRVAVTRWLFAEGRSGLVYHWNKLYYQGIAPPRALASYPAVALMVARVPGAIGYLPADQPHPNLRILRVPGVTTAAVPDSP